MRRMLTPSSLKDTLFLRPAFLGRAPVLRALPLLLVLLEALESLEDLLMGVLLLEEDDDDDDEEFVTVRGDAGGRRELLRDLGESESSESLLSDELSCWRTREKQVSAIPVQKKKSANEASECMQKSGREKKLELNTHCALWHGEGPPEGRSVLLVEL